MNLNRPLHRALLLLPLIIPGSAQTLVNMHAPVATPALILANTPTSVTITIYLPAKTLIPSSVNLLTVGANGQELAIVGQLHDDGMNGDQTANDHVYSFQFALSNASPVLLRVSAAYLGTLRRQTADVSIQVISPPVISASTDYNTQAATLLNSALSARTSIMTLASGKTATSTDALNEFAALQLQLGSIASSLYAIIAYESSASGSAQGNMMARPGRALRPLDVPSVFPGGDAANAIVNAGQATASASDLVKLFGADGTDPRVAAIATFCMNTVDLTSTDSLDVELREQCAVTAELQLSNSNSFLSTVQSDTKTFAVRNTTEVPTDLIGDGISGLFQLGTLATQAVTGLTGIVIDAFTIPQAQASGVLVASVSNPDNIQVPAGMSDVIYSFGETTTRALTENVSIQGSSNIGLVFTPGATLNLSVTPSQVGSLVAQVNVSGVSWPGAITYSIFGPNGTLVENVAPLTIVGLSPGQYTVVYSSGGPLNDPTTGLLPTATQTLTGGGVITFTFQFTKPTYTVTDLGTLPNGASYPVVTGMNASGVVVGWQGQKTTTDGAGVHGFVAAGGPMTDLYPPVASVNGINDLGQMIGEENVTGGSVPFLSSGGQLTNLGPLFPNGSDMRAINNLGQVVGDAFNINDVDTFVRYAGGVVTWVGVCASVCAGTLYGINDSGQMVGQIYGGNGVFIDGSTVANLGGAAPTAINSLGHVVGSNSNGHGFIWNAQGGFTDLGLLPGYVAGGANAINSSDEVVGRLCCRDTAFMWNKASGMVNLNNVISTNSGWYLESGDAINDRGQIAGHGVYNGQEHAFLLTPE